ncbi:archaellin/type IV pilin N-terminal domain-containing protein [archaeon]
MEKGLSPIIAIVLILAITVIAGVTLYFWVIGTTAQQPTPSTPRTITARMVECTETDNSTMLISNVSPPGRTVNSSLLNVTSGTLYCPENETMESKDQIFCEIDGFNEGDGTISIYGNNVGSADVTC